MKRKFYYSIFFKILIACFILISLTLIFITYNNINRETNQSHQDLKDQGGLVLEILAKNLKDPLYYLDIDTCSDIMETLGENSQLISTGRLFSKTGHLIADGFDELLTYKVAPDPRGIELLSIKEIQYTWTKDEILMGKSISIGNLRIGAIEIGLSLQKFNNKIIKIRNESIRLSLISFIIFLIVIYLITRNILKSLEKLTGAVQRLGEMDYDIDLPIESRDEIGILVRSFNTMKNNLQKTYSKLHTSEERYSLAVKGANDGIWDWNMKSNQIYYSSRWMEIIGYTEEKEIDDFDFWASKVHPDDADKFNNVMTSHGKGKDSLFQVEYRIKHSSGDYSWVQTKGAVTISRDGEVTRVAGSQTDINLNKQIEGKLRKSAFYDFLTGLPNRILLQERISHELSKVKRNHQYQFVVMYLDYDGFKNVNDTYGHHVGDLLLKQMSQRLISALRPTDTVSRLGGDEFVILLEDNNNLSSAENIASRIIADANKEFLVDGNSIFISVSIGIVENGPHSLSTEDLLKNSDAAMYQSKLNGKGQYCIYNSEMRKDISHKWKLENDLHKAISENQLVVYYQPIIDPHSNEVSAFEALLRWNHPIEGLIFPDSFIPAAEESGFITEITKWVIHMACIQAKEWNSKSDNLITIFVNISAKDFFIPNGLSYVIKSALKETGCKADWFGIEVTERVFIENDSIVTNQLNIIKAMGIHIDLDDFGTGYSSLSYLQKFPLTGLKIDRSFISSIMTDEMSKKIIKTIISLAKDLNLHVIAEGVEEKDQLEQLKRLECDFIQGYYYSKAITSSEAEQFLENFHK